MKKDFTPRPNRAAHDDDKHSKTSSGTARSSGAIAAAAAAAAPNELTATERAVLLAIRKDNGLFLFGFQVKSGRALERRGLVTIEDNGPIRQDGKSDRERYWSKLTPDGIACALACDRERRNYFDRPDCVPTEKEMRDVASAIHSAKDAAVRAELAPTPLHYARNVGDVVAVCGARAAILADGRRFDDSTTIAERVTCAACADAVYVQTTEDAGARARGADIRYGEDASRAAAKKRKPDAARDAAIDRSIAARGREAQKESAVAAARLDATPKPRIVEMRPGAGRTNVVTYEDGTTAVLPINPPTPSPTPSPMPWEDVCHGIAQDFIAQAAINISEGHTTTTIEVDSLVHRALVSFCEHELQRNHGKPTTSAPSIVSLYAGVPRLYWSEQGRIACVDHKPHEHTDAWQHERWSRMTSVDFAESTAAHKKHGLTPPCCETCEGLARQKRAPFPIRAFVGHASARELCSASLDDAGRMKTIGDFEALYPSTIATAHWNEFLESGHPLAIHVEDIHEPETVWICFTIEKEKTA